MIKRGVALLYIALGLFTLLGPLSVVVGTGWSFIEAYSHYWRNIVVGVAFLMSGVAFLDRTRARPR